MLSRGRAALALWCAGTLCVAGAEIAPSNECRQDTLEEPAARTPAVLELFARPSRRAEDRAVGAAPIARDPRMLRLKVAAFDPVLKGSPDFTGLLPPGPALRDPSAAGGEILLIQFDRPVDETIRRNLTDLGATILDPVPSRALLVRMPAGGSSARLGSIPGRRFSMPFSAGFRLAPDLFLALRDEENAKEWLTLDIAVFHDADLHALSRAVQQRFDKVVIEPHETRLPRRLTMTVAPEKLAKLVGALIRDPAVAFVEQREPLSFHNDNSAWIGQSYDRVYGPVEAQAADPKPYTQSATLWNRGLTGVGEIVAVNDGGLDFENCFFHDPSRPITPQFVPPSEPLGVDLFHRKVVAFNTPSGMPNGDGYVRHGTHVSGTVAGDNLANLTGGPATAGHDHGDGMAPGAKILFQDIGGAQEGSCSQAPNPPNGIFEQAYAGGARLSTNSYGGGGGYYDTASIWIDTLTWNHEDYLIFFSAGNEGTNGFSNWAACKNCVAVGASENYDGDFLDTFGILDPENAAAFSSVGPAADGRIKPDIMASGYLVSSNRYPSTFVSDPEDPACDPDDPDVCFLSNGCIVNDSSQTCHVDVLLGTSVSSPTVAGLAALVRQYFADGFHPTGQAQPTDAFNPSAALVKAVLLNGARNMTGRRYERRVQPVDFGALADAPSNTQGWGRVMLDDALYFTGDTRRLLRFELDNASGLATGESIAIKLSVTSATQPLKATLVWTDPPGSPVAGIALVNDLDLELLAPDGTVYRGNQWTGDDVAVPGDKESAPDPSGRDALNNVEGVLVKSPQVGVHTMTLRGLDVPGYQGTSTQGFALVLTGALEPLQCTTADGPQNLAPVSVGSGHVDLAWDPVPGAIGYRLYRNTSFCRDPMPADLVVSLPAGRTNYTDTAVQPESGYNYTVKALTSAEGCETVDSNCVSVITLPPPEVQAVDPVFGLNNDPTPLTITGADFLPGIRVFLGTSECPDKIELTPVGFVDGGHIGATVPVNLPSGKYEITVVNPDGLEDSLPETFAVAAPLQKSTLYVPSYSDNYISVIDVESFEEIDRIATRNNWNMDLAIVNPLQGVVVRRRQPVYLETFNPLTHDAVDLLPEPSALLLGIVVHPDRTRVFVLARGSTCCPPSVSVLHADSLAVLATIEVGELIRFVNREDIEILPDGSQVYATSSEDGTVSIIDTATYTEIARPTVGESPRNLQASNDSTRLYVLNYHSDTVSVIDTATQAVVDTLAVASNRDPESLAISPDDRTLYVGFSEPNGRGGLAVYDIATGAEMRSDFNGFVGWTELRYYEQQDKLYGLRAEYYPQQEWVYHLSRIDPITLTVEASIPLELATAMAFLEPVPPDLTGFAPGAGCFGTLVTLTGSGFQGEIVDDFGTVVQERTRVFFGTLEATSVTFHDSGTLRVVAPQHSLVPVDIRVENPSGMTAILRSFLYQSSCDGLQIAPPVPDGTFGSPMTASRTDLLGTTLSVSWDVSTCQAEDYHILYGALGSVRDMTLAGSRCALGTSGSYEWLVDEPTDLWFLIVADSPSASEGTWGNDSQGLPRNGATPSLQCSVVSRMNDGSCP